MSNRRSTRPAAGNLAGAVFLGLLAAGLSFQHPAFANDAAPAAPRAKHVNFERERASDAARHIADWVLDSGDNHATDSRLLPFAIVDKKDARVFVFDAQARLLGTAPALLGQSRGDDAIPGIGDRALSSIRVEEKTTPAGRFVAALGESTRGEDVLWVDYAGAVSMHRVITSNVKERRAQRLATPTPDDNRITFGCINIPKKFYEEVVRTTFHRTYGIVYVLPETKSNQSVFSSYDVEEHARLSGATRN